MPDPVGWAKASRVAPSCPIPVHDDVHLSEHLGVGDSLVKVHLGSHMAGFLLHLVQTLEVGLHVHSGQGKLLRGVFQPGQQTLQTVQVLFADFFRRLAQQVELPLLALQPKLIVPEDAGNGVGALLHGLDFVHGEQSPP